tara:strand:- start:193 stop:798 length:606 start_codon:yes stop_codon:yes gene_type:complete
MSENNILAVILAGGRSKRFGNDKTHAKLGNKTLIDHTIAKLKKSYSEILVISNNENINLKQKDVFLTQDLIKGHLGPLVGVLSAMEWINQNKKKYNWIATYPCDTPFFDEGIVSLMKDCPKKYKDKLFFLKNQNKRHNIFGLWSIELKQTLLNDIKNGHRKVEEWANKIGCKIIEIKNQNDYNFLNINTKEDLEEAKKKIK